MSIGGVGTCRCVDRLAIATRVETSIIIIATAAYGAWPTLSEVVVVGAVASEVIQRTLAAAAATAAAKRAASGASHTETTEARHIGTTEARHIGTTLASHTHAAHLHHVHMLHLLMHLLHLLHALFEDVPWAGVIAHVQRRGVATGSGDWNER